VTYTLKNLRDDVEDMAPKHGMPDFMSARFASGALGLERSGLSLQRLEAGGEHPFGHSHKTQEEVYVVIEGGGQAKLGDEVVQLRTLDALRVPPETPRSFAGGEDGMTFLAFGAPKVDDAMADVEQQPGFADAGA
jgi:quercetin dioxygenase-like cupin family protein